MAALAVAGVELPVAAESLKMKLEEVGYSGRNTRGRRVMDRRRAKWTFEFELAPQSIDEAQMYRALLLGEGEFWSTLTDAYGAKGLQLTGSGAWTGAGGGNPLNTNGVFKATTGQSMIVPGRLYTQADVSTAPGAALVGATLIGWRYDGSAYRIFGFSWRARATTVDVKREMIGSLGASGAPQNYTGTETMSVSIGNLTITAPGAGGPWSWSNMTLIPWFLPASLVDVLMKGLSTTLYTLPRLPRVYVTTDLLPNTQQLATGGQASLICHGAADELVLMPGALAGTWQLVGGLKARLIEV